MMIPQDMAELDELRSSESLKTRRLDAEPIAVDTRSGPARVTEASLSPITVPWATAHDSDHDGLVHVTQVATVDVTVTVTA